MTGPLPVTRFGMRGKQTVEAALSLDLPGKRTSYMHMRLNHTLRVEGSFSKRKQEEPAARARWPMPRTSRVQRLAASPSRAQRVARRGGHPTTVASPVARPGSRTRRPLPAAAVAAAASQPDQTQSRGTARRSASAPASAPAAWARGRGRG
mgnify:CR=1 FL=1